MYHCAQKNLHTMCQDKKKAQFAMLECHCNQQWCIIRCIRVFASVPLFKALGNKQLNKGKLSYCKQVSISGTLNHHLWKIQNIIILQVSTFMVRTWYGVAWSAHERDESTWPCQIWTQVSAVDALRSSPRSGPAHNQACSGSRRADHSGSCDAKEPLPRKCAGCSSRPRWATCGHCCGCG